MRILSYRFGLSNGPFAQDFLVTSTDGGQRPSAPRCRVGDGTRGLPEQAPFDAIIVAAAFPEVPEPLADQLVGGGRLVQPIGPGGVEDVILFHKDGKGLTPERSLTAARFVPLYGEHGYVLEEAPAEP